MHRYFTSWLLGALLIGIGAAAAQPIPPQSIPSRSISLRGPLPPYEITTIIRSLSFEPLGWPELQGFVYRLPALDSDDVEVMLTVDARSGRVLAAAPVIFLAYPPQSWPSARIIPVPSELEEFDRPPAGIERRRGPMRPPGLSQLPPRQAIPVPRIRPEIMAIPQTEASPATTGSISTPSIDSLSKPAQYPVQPLD